MKLDTLLLTLKDKIMTKIKKLIEDFEDAMDANLDDEKYFKKDWNEINFDLDFNGVKYFAEMYPLDIYESDTIVLRAYADEDKLDESEFGNGIWFDSDFGIVDGNDELYFDEQDDKHDEILSALLNKAEMLLRTEEII
jgi:hypothetical protein